MYLCQLDCLLKDLHVCLFLFSVERRLTYLCLAVMYPCQVVLASPSQVRIPQASSRRMLKGKREVDDLMKQFYVHPKVKCKNKLQPASLPIGNTKSELSKEEMRNKLWCPVFVFIQGACLCLHLCLFVHVMLTSAPAAASPFHTECVVCFTSVGTRAPIVNPHHLKGSRKHPDSEL